MEANSQDRWNMTKFWLEFDGNFFTMANINNNFGHIHTLRSVVVVINKNMPQAGFETGSVEDGSWLNNRAHVA